MRRRRRTSREVLEQNPLHERVVEDIRRGIAHPRYRTIYGGPGQGMFAFRLMIEYDDPHQDPRRVSWATWVKSLFGRRGLGPKPLS